MLGRSEEEKRRRRVDVGRTEIGILQRERRIVGMSKEVGRVKGREVREEIEDRDIKSKKDSRGYKTRDETDDTR